jgi:hypothetical protein
MSWSAATRGAKVFIYKYAKFKKTRSYFSRSELKDYVASPGDFLSKTIMLREWK